VPKRIGNENLFSFFMKRRFFQQIAPQKDAHKKSQWLTGKEGWAPEARSTTNYFVGHKSSCA
jgi:hypothetical protein